jgi:hypothetical protein
LPPPAAGVVDAGQHLLMLRQVVDRVQHDALAHAQALEHLRALVEEVVQQLGGHHRVVGGEVAPAGQHGCWAAWFRTK